MRSKTLTYLVGVFRLHVLSSQTELLHWLAILASFDSLRLNMHRKSLFKRHRFPRDIILCAAHWYLRYPSSYQDVVET